MALAFGWNAALEGKTIDWALAKQGASFAYLEADSAYQQAAQDAKGNLRVGPYYTLATDVDGAEQATLFLSRMGGPPKAYQLPPAVFVKSAKLKTVKLFVERLEATTKRRTLIGGTPQSLKGMGPTFGRSNPLWISHKPVFGGPSLPDGWQDFALWQTPPPRPYKGVSGEVGFNVANTSWLDDKRVEKAALGLGALLLGGAVLYYWAKPTKENTP